MKTVLKLEEAAMTIASLYLLGFYDLGLSTWIWVLLFFAPDIGMLGYVVNNRAGAFTYNIFHHKGIACVVALCGYLLHQDVIVATGILLFAHASFDRILGYGLKYSDGFKKTHLGNL
jgi:hypothetical protein